MTWYNKLQFTAMLLAVAGVAIDWHVGLWTALGFGGVSVVCLVAQIATRHHVGNRALRAPMRWGLLAVVVYWLLLLASVLYSKDLSAASDVLVLKATLLIFPLVLLLTDTSWLGSAHLRALGYVLVTALIGVFLYHIGVAVGKVIDGSKLASLLRESQFDGRHHTYTALYLAVALLFAYYELYTRWRVLPRWWRGLLLAAVPLMILYTVIVNSRAGMLVLYAIEAFCVLHFAITRRRWGWALLLAALLAGYTVGVEKALPGHSERIAKTVSDVSSDVRIQIYENDLDVSMESPIVGYGAGDYQQELNDEYKTKGKKYHFNAHNQYFESLLSTGFVGLAVLLFWLFWPLWLAWRAVRRRMMRGAAFWIVFMLTFCIAFNFMFESMLERQMGLLFIGALLPIMTLIVNCEQNKFGQLRKK